jgi:hypothetical protein
LRGAIEQFEGAVGEEIMLARSKHGDANPLEPARLVASPQQHRAGGWNRRGRPHGDRANAGQQIRDRSDQDLARSGGRGHAAARGRRTKASM